MSKKIKLYTLKGCPACTKAKKFLDEKGADYEEIDINDDPEKVKEISGGTKIEIPIICSTKKCEIGFDEKTFEKMIKD